MYIIQTKVYEFTYYIRFDTLKGWIYSIQGLKDNASTFITRQEAEQAKLALPEHRPYEIVQL